MEIKINNPSDHQVLIFKASKNYRDCDLQAIYDTLEASVANGVVLLPHDIEFVGANVEIETC